MEKTTEVKKTETKSSGSGILPSTSSSTTSSSTTGSNIGASVSQLGSDISTGMHKAAQAVGL